MHGFSPLTRQLSHTTSKWFYLYFSDAWRFFPYLKWHHSLTQNPKESECYHDAVVNRPNIVLHKKKLSKLMECKLVQETATDCSAQTFKLSRQLKSIEWGNELCYSSVCFCRYPRLNWTFYTPLNAYRHSNWMQSTFPFFFPPFLCVSPLCAKPVYSMNSLHPTVSCVCIGFSNSPPARCQCITDNIRTVCFHRSRSSACMYPFVKLDCARFSHWKCQAEYCRTQHWNAFHRGSCERFCIFVYNFANALVYRFGRYTQLK